MRNHHPPSSPHTPCTHSQYTVPVLLPRIRFSFRFTICLGGGLQGLPLFPSCHKARTFSVTEPTLGFCLRFRMCIPTLHPAVENWGRRTPPVPLQAGLPSSPTFHPTWCSPGFPGISVHSEQISQLSWKLWFILFPRTQFP